MKRLIDILQHKRPHGSATLDTFVENTFHDYDYDIWRTEKGEPIALAIVVGDASRTLFSCHLDTVHRTEGMQEICYDKSCELIWVPEKATECLGADDGAGIWLMLEMIDAKVPGSYIFHYGEERGGIGSTHIAANFPEFLTTFDRAVAFDRRGTCSIITHQGFGRCCSDTFADALSSLLGDANPKVDMWPDSTGIFTDTANYTDFIGECTNVSCGYDSEHSDSETLNVTFLSDLLDALLKVEWETLPTDRQPGEEEIPAYKGFGYASYGASYGASAGSYALDDLEELSRMKYRDLLDWVRKHTKDPEYIADVLYEALAEMQPVAPQSGPFYEEDDWV